MNSTPFLLNFLFLTACLPFMLRYGFVEKLSRHMWESRNNSVFIKPFRPDTSEAAYQRFRFFNRAVVLLFALVWACMALKFTADVLGR